MKTRKYWIVAVALTVCVGILWAAETVLQPNTLPVLKTPDFSKITADPVVRIIDGDTIVIDHNGKQVKVRLIGVDTPETVHPSKPVEHYGKEASRFTRNLLKGEKVYLATDTKQAGTDRYGRTLGYVYRAPDGLFVNAEIIRQGYGHAYTRFPFKYMEQFRQLEQFARKVKKGLWAPVPLISKPKPERQPDPNDIVYRDRKRTRLWFDRMYERFHDKIAYVEGEYFDITNGLRESPDGVFRPKNAVQADKMIWPVGTLVRFPYSNNTVTSVLGKGEILVRNSPTYHRTIVVHLHGLEGKFTNAQEIPNINNMRFLYSGTYSYTHVSGAPKTVPSLVLYQPLTREQFAEAIKNGIELFYYTRRGERKPIR